MLNDIYVTVGGIEYTRWKTLKINRSLESLSGGFELNITDVSEPENNNSWALRTQEECIIRIDDDKLIRGYIDNVQCETAKNEHKVTVIGRDITGDVVDCSYIEKKTSWSKITLLALTNTLIKPFGLRAKLDVGVTDTRSFQFSLNTNESIFDNLKKKALNFGILLITNNDGDILLTNSGSTKAGTILSLGIDGNILNATAMYDYTNRFSKYVIYAQAPSKQNRGAWKTNISVKVSSQDTGVLRYRPKLIKAGSPLSRSGAQEYANWEATVRAGKSQEVTVVVQGFRQSTNALWQLNSLVTIYAPLLYINPATEMLITSIEYILTSNGTFTKMTLKRKDAFDKSPIAAKTVKSVTSLGWNQLKKPKLSTQELLDTLAGQQ